MSNFLITGLPRSRTAWLSALCCAMPGAICYHEPVSWHPSWQACLSLWDRDRPAAIGVGISDSGLGFHLGRIIKHYSPRVLVVDRPKAEVEASLMAIGIAAPRYCDLLLDRINAAANSPCVMRASFARLQDSNMVLKCLRWLMPDCEIDLEKIVLFQRLNIQADLAYVHQQSARRSKDIEAILGADVVQALTA